MHCDWLILRFAAAAGNYCFDQTCSGRGTCVNLDDDFECQCDFGFLGRTCSRQGCVNGAVCENGGYCT